VKDGSESRGTIIRETFGEVFSAWGFSVIFVVLGIAWAFLFSALLLVGYIIGLVIGILVLLFIIGWLNAGVISMIWDVSIRTDWKNLLADGLVLLLGLFVAHIPAIIVIYVAPGLPGSAVMFVVNCFIDGFVAKSIAGYWREEYEE
jgi:hypothetical protein